MGGRSRANRQKYECIKKGNYASHESFVRGRCILDRGNRRVAFQIPTRPFFCTGPQQFFANTQWWEGPGTNAQAFPQPDKKLENVEE